MNEIIIFLNKTWQINDVVRGYEIKRLKTGHTHTVTEAKDFSLYFDNTPPLPKYIKDFMEEFHEIQNGVSSERWKEYCAIHGDEP